MSRATGSRVVGRRVAAARHPTAPGLHRSRYAEEWAADLAAQAPGERAAYAASVLGHVLALRHSLVGGRPAAGGVAVAVSPAPARLRLSP